MALPLGLGELALDMHEFRIYTRVPQGSIFNHSRNPNVYYRLNKQLDTIEYTTARQIASGEELCVYYALL